MEYFFLDKNFILKLENFKLLLKNRVRGVKFGENRSNILGSGIEISHLKNYSLGEDIKLIDWNASIRTNKLFIKIFTQTQENIIYILIDTSNSMKFGNEQLTKLLFAIKLAYSITYIALNGTNKIIVGCFNDKINDLFNINLSNINIHFKNIIDKYVFKSSDCVNNFSNLLSEITVKLKKKGIIFLISDFFDSNFLILEFIKKVSLVHYLGIIHILSNDDIIANLNEYKEYILVDAETNEKLELFLTPQVINDYNKNFNEFCKTLENSTIKYGGLYKKIFVNNDLIDVLKDIIIKANLQYNY